MQVEMLQLVDVEEGIDNSETTLRAFLNSVDALHGADSFAAYASHALQHCLLHALAARSMLVVCSCRVHPLKALA